MISLTGEVGSLRISGTWIGLRCAVAAPMASPRPICRSVIAAIHSLAHAIGGMQANRWPNYTLSDSGFTFWRLLALPDGGVLALDRTKSQLGKVTGQPLPTGPQDTPDVGILRSCR